MDHSAQRLSRWYDKIVSLSATMNRRRSTRVILKVPLLLQDVDADGHSHIVRATTIMVSKHGARVHTGKHLVKSNEVVVTIPNTGRKQKAKVVLAWEQSLGVYECAIELEHRKTCGAGPFLRKTGLQNGQRKKSYIRNPWKPFTQLRLLDRENPKWISFAGSGPTYQACELTYVRQAF
jgi:hypothetical protein